MKRNKQQVAISDDVIVNKIFATRGKRVMIDSDLAEIIWSVDETFE